MIETQIKNCLTCNKTLKGRTDKKFCDDYCRNTYNNQLKADDNNTIRKINNALRRNRRILSGLLAENEMAVKANREKLLESGFQFRYHTHFYTNNRGNVYHFCYEYGYLNLENGWYLVVKHKE
jgi:hypothetical protein